MYVLDHALLEVDIWVKKERDESTDKQILSEYVEIYVRSTFDKKLKGLIPSDHCMLDMDYMTCFYQTRTSPDVILISQWTSICSCSLQRVLRLSYSLRKG